MLTGFFLLMLQAKKDFAVRLIDCELNKLVQLDFPAFGFVVSIPIYKYTTYIPRYIQSVLSGFAGGL